MNVISRYLSHDDVVLGLNVPDKLRALEEAALLVESHHHVNHAPVFRALWRREQSASTGLGHGIAVPHARIAGIAEPIVLIVRTRAPIKFDSPDRRGVSVLLVILIPEHATEEHLQILATISQMFSDADFRDRVERAEEPAAIQRLIDGWTGELPPAASMRDGPIA
jgi:PTS system nitrogen regulatory IIA component